MDNVNLKKRFLLIFSLSAAVLLALALLYFNRRASEKPTNWNGTLIDFLISEKSPNFGLIPAPAAIKDGIEKNLFPSAIAVSEERASSLIAPVPAYFTDIGRSGWTIYRYTGESIFSCNILFGSKTADDFSGLYQSVISALEEALGRAEQTKSEQTVTGSAGVPFHVSISKERLFAGCMVSGFTWDCQGSDPAYGITAMDYFEPYSEGIMGIGDLADQYVMMLRITVYQK